MNNVEFSMEKKEYIQKIDECMERCNDLSLLDLICALLRKSF